jgi:hypothetical protein
MSQSKRVTDKGISHVAKTCKGLKILKLDVNRNLTSKSITDLANNCDLTHLDLGNALIPATDLHPLKQCSKLTFLALKWCKLTDTELELIATSKQCYLKVC